MDGEIFHDGQNEVHIESVPNKLIFFASIAAMKSGGKTIANTAEDDFAPGHG